MRNQTNFFDQVYKVVRQIPPGKVATYGTVAGLLGTADARKVGWALHANSDRQTPCHRVVNREGKVAPNFAFNGWQEQRRLLEAEGISFVDETHVNLVKHRWNG